MTIIDDMPMYFEDEPPEPPKKPKKKKLTKAEKKALKLLKQQANKRIIMRDHLKRELELSKRNAFRGQKEWKDMCKEIKLTEMRTELEEWHHRANRMLQSKDDVIESMFKDMEDTNEQYSRAFNQQIEIINYISDTYNTVLQSSKAIYEQFAGQMVETFYNEAAEKEEGQQQLQEYYESVMHNTNLLFEEKIKSDYGIFSTRRDKTVGKEIASRYMLRDEIVKKMNAAQKQMKKYIEVVKDKRRNPYKYERIAHQTRRQENYQAEAKKNTDIEEKNRVTLHALRRKYLQAELEANRQISDLKTELRYFTQQRNVIVIHLQKNKLNMEEKLKIVCTEAYTLKKHFDKLLKYAELVLSLSTCCRKFQTELEKTVHSQAFLDGLPWKEEDTQFVLEAGCNLIKKETLVDPDPEDEDQDNQKIKTEFVPIRTEPGVCKLRIATADIEQCIGISEEEVVRQMHIMKYFWRRVALVKADNLALTIEKNRLTAENEKYINFIKNMGKTDDISSLTRALKCKTVARAPPKSCTEFVLKRGG